jgi:hypothetical protein
VIITIDDGMVACGCRSVGECSHNTFAEIKALEKLVDAFAGQMKKKLREKWMEGRHGWDDPTCAKGIRIGMLAHVNRGAGQEVDVANMAAMLWNFGSETDGSGDANG